MNSVNYTARHSNNKYDCVKKYMESLVSISKQEKLDVNSLLNLMVNKIKNTKIFNLDDETLFMEFEDRVLNG